MPSKKKSIKMFDLTRITSHRPSWKNLFTTDEGRIGSGPPGTAPGGLLAYMAGVPVPMILQRARCRNDYFVADPVYVQGFTDGEEIDETQMESLNLV